MKNCPFCGHHLKGGEHFCAKCGRELPAEDVFLSSNDTNYRSVTPEPSYHESSWSDPIQPEPVQPEPIWPEPVTPEPIQPEPIRPEPVKPVDSLSDSGATFSSVQSKFKDMANSAASKVSDAMPIQQGAAHMASSGSATAQMTAPVRQKPKSSKMQSYLSQSDLWTWLKKDDRRQLFFIDDRPALTEDHYMDLLSQKILDNRVPATIERKQIRWDNSDVETQSYFVKPSTTAVNPLTCILQFAQVGAFSFVEQKTFLAPPNLPAVPQKKKPVPEDSFKFFLIGAIFIVAGMYLRTAGIAGLVLLAIGIGSIAWGVYSGKSRSDIIAHNAECDRQEIAYEKAWDDWVDTVFVHSFQESTNGKVSRIYQAVFECIRQVNAEQFQGLESIDEREDTSLHELQSQIAQRKDNYR